MPRSISIHSVIHTTHFCTYSRWHLHSYTLTNVDSLISILIIHSTLYCSCKILCIMPPASHQKKPKRLNVPSVGRSRSTTTHLLVYCYLIYFHITASFNIPIYTISHPFVVPTSLSPSTSVSLLSQGKWWNTPMNATTPLSLKWIPSRFPITTRPFPYPCMSIWSDEDCFRIFIDKKKQFCLISIWSCRTVFCTMRKERILRR